MSKREDMYIKHSVIFDFWKDKYIDVDGEIAYKYKKNYVPVVNDWGEPSCWCCGKFCRGIYDNNQYFKDLDNDVKKIWDYKVVRSTLNRCHIIAHSLGGSSTADNLFLMCESCHIKAPDCNDTRLFFKWIYYKRKQNVCIYNGFELNDILKELSDIRKMYKKNDIEISCDNVVATQEKIQLSSQGGKISSASLIMSLLDID